jgi:hypothetical protein
MNLSEGSSQSFRRQRTLTRTTAAHSIQQRQQAV